jgi:hypothetical protein
MNKKIIIIICAVLFICAICTGSVILANTLFDNQITQFKQSILGINPADPLCIGCGSEKKFNTKIVIKNQGEYFLKDNIDVSLVGMLSITNGKINYVISQPSAINNYIEENSTRWETSELEYPTGGVTSSGAYWDGTATTDISKPDFLNAIYVELSDNYPEYVFEME